MRVKITVSGHRTWYQIEGELLRVSESIEQYEGKYFQVPALIIDSGDGIWVVNLKQRLLDVDVEYIKKEEEEELELETT